jgi:hypothetical protein
MVDLDLVLRAVAEGRVTCPHTGYNAPHLLDGQDVSLDVKRLGHYELIRFRLSGPPEIQPLGEELLSSMPAGHRFTMAELPAKYRQDRSGRRRRRPRR